LAFTISKGSIAYVLPDSILIKDFAKTRRLLLPNLSHLLWYQNIGVPEGIRPFRDVEHDVCVIVTDQQPGECLACSTTSYAAQTRALEVRKWQVQKSDMILEEFEYAFNLMLKDEDLSILKKLRQFPRVDSFLQCHEGIHTGNVRELLFKQNAGSKTCKPLFYGGGAGDVICNYASQRSGWFVNYRKDIIDKKKGEYASLRDEDIFRLPKIYISRTGNPFKAFLDEQSYASNNFFSLQYTDRRQNTVENLKAVLPFIVSPVAQYFVRKFAAPRLGNTFVETKIIHLLKLRVPQVGGAVRNKLTMLVDKIIEKRRTEIAGDTSEWEREANTLVYESYGLCEFEISLIEGR